MDEWGSGMLPSCLSRLSWARCEDRNDSVAMANFAGRFLLLGDEANEAVGAEKEDPEVASLITIDSIISSPSSTVAGSSSADPMPHADASSPSISWLSRPFWWLFLVNLDLKKIRF